MLQSVQRVRQVFVDIVLWNTSGMKRVMIAGLLVLLLAGCAGKEPLPARAAGNPEQVDLTGLWELRGGAPRPAAEEQTIRVPKAISRSEYQRRGQGQPRSSRSRPDGSSVHVFMTSGRTVRISQTEYALFFSYDRAIVREFNFGENRMVNVGPIQGQRVSGWDGGTFVIETMDESGTVLTESWSLEEGGDVLVREVSIVGDDEAGHESRQVFDRQ